ncbi:MAG: phosphatidylserine decarboxylase [Kiritimatiellae bacterium]|nr:phosphatidylserine decarboxylase [Kiritimatiellia bacterium]
MEEPTPDFSNKAYLLPHINPEGVKFGAIALCVAAVVAVLAGSIHMLTYFTIPAFLLAYGVFLFFRDPDRYPPEDEKAILSPADGRICLIQECELPDSLADGKKYWRVSVFMSVFNVHVNRMPTAGEILKKEYVAAGKFFNASLDKASKENERCNYLVKAENGQTYGVTQIAGLVARRIVPQVEEGQKLNRIQRFGLIRFGSRLDVYLPEGVKPEVRVGQIMVAGETVLGHLA